MAAKLASYVAEYKGKGVQVYTPTKEEYARSASIRDKVWEEVHKQQPSSDPGPCTSDSSFRQVVQDAGCKHRRPYGGLPALQSCVR
jgi:hypothetical protein